MHKVDGQLFVGCMHIPPRGLVGHHQATIPQLFMVVSGEGWVRGGEGDRHQVKTGDAALWAADEWHEAGSEMGMTVVVIEYDVGGPATQET